MGVTSDDDIFKCNFFNENVLISISISLNLVPEGQTDNKISLVQVVAYRLTGATPLPEPMITRLNEVYMRHSGSMI